MRWGAATVPGVITPATILLDGRRALVTGGARGIGRATAEALAAFGADVAVCDRLPEELADCVSSLEGLGASVISAELDVRDPEAVAAFVEQVAAEWGVLDILVNTPAAASTPPSWTCPPRAAPPSWPRTSPRWPM